jgi:hypothetical protein
MFGRRAVFAVAPLVALAAGLLPSAACATATEVRLTIFSDFKCSEGTYRIYFGKTLEDAREKATRNSISDLDLISPDNKPLDCKETANPGNEAKYRVGDVTLDPDGNPGKGAVLVTFDKRKPLRDSTACRVALASSKEPKDNDCFEATAEFNYVKNEPRYASVVILNACGGNGCRTDTGCNVSTGICAKSATTVVSVDLIKFSCGGLQGSTCSTSTQALATAVVCAPNAVCGTSCAAGAAPQQLCCTEISSAGGPPRACCIEMVSGFQLPIVKSGSCDPSARACFSDGDCKTDPARSKCKSVDGNDSLKVRGFGVCKP